MAKRRVSEPKDVLPWLPWLVAVIPLIVFYPVLFNGFVWDDEILIVSNFNFRGLGLSNLMWMFSAPRFGQYHPLTWVSFAIDYLFFGMDPSGYHVVNLLLHCVNGILFYQVARALLAKALPEASEENVLWGAGFAALFFALHPLRVETVAWVTERRGLLSGLFLLTALIAYLQEAVGASLVLYAASLLCKASGVVLPAVLVLIDRYPLRRSGKRVWLEKLAFLAVAVPFGLIAPLAQAREGALQTFSTYGLMPRIGQAAFASLFYIWKTIAPWHLNPFVRFPDRLNFLFDGWILFSLFASVAISAAAAAFYRTRPAGIVLWASYLAWLAPVSGIVQSGPHFVADRYSYLACLSWALLAGAGFVWFAQRRRDLALACGGAVLLLLGMLSWRQVRVWRNPQTLWNYVVTLDPRSYLAHNNLCTALRDAGTRDEALKHCQTALELRPEYAQARCNLGNLLVDDGKVEDAIGQFQIALRIAPDDPIARFDLAVAYERLGRVDQAVKEYETAVSLKPDYTAARNNLGAALALQTRSEDAVHEFERAITLDPTDSKAHFNLGNVYYQSQRFDKAAGEFELALKASPRDARGHLNLGVCLNALGRHLEAAQHLQAAIRLKPDFPEAFNNLGIVLFQQGRFQEAVDSFDRAVRLKPDYTDAKFNLDRATRLLKSARPAR